MIALVKDSKTKAAILAILLPKLELRTFSFCECGIKLFNNNRVLHT